jgi:aryl-alcohol dehydrogenase-like predicted oxidoreductase
LIRAVGVSNYSTNQTQKAFDALGKRSIPFASNQVKYSLLDRHPERSGLADVCKKLKVTLIAYSHLEKGILPGKYTSENRPQGFLSWRYNKTYLDKIDPIITNLCEIGEAHGSKTTAQVALNWLICKGAVPIPGARNPQQAQDNAGALDWQLGTEEVNRLDGISHVGSQ